MILQGPSWDVACYAILSLISSCFIAEVRCHIGEKCGSFFSGCLFAPHTHCDSDNICRCQPDYPVILGPHDCARARKYDDRCKDHRECMHHDENSLCSDPMHNSGRCDCKSDYRYDPTVGVCVKDTVKRRESPGYLLPTTLGLTFAGLSVICCCIALCHVLRRHFMMREEGWQIFSRWNTCSRRHRTSQMSASARHVDRIAVPQAPERDMLPSYESVVFSPSDDQAPPPYEEAIKSPPITEEKV